MYSCFVPAVVGVGQRQAAAEHLAEHPAELLRGHVVQQRVDDGAQVEEGVGEGQEDHVGPEVGFGPVVLGFGRRHNPPHLVRHPADSQDRQEQHERSNARNKILSAPVLCLLARKWCQFFNVALDRFACHQRKGISQCFKAGGVDCVKDHSML
uniref:Uncharacterized protein n=2 Tax=Ursus TaxID=9639 RepID=A0A452TF11_URSMA